MVYAPDLPEGLTSIADLGVFSEVDDLENDENLRDMAQLVVRSVGVLIRYTAQQPEWTAENIPYEIRVLSLEASRRVFNNPAVQSRIQTGPLGESYSPEELTGLSLKAKEEELLETFIPAEEGSMGDLNIIKSVRPDPIDFAPHINALRAPAYGIGGGLVNGKMPTTSIPSLSHYLGVEQS